MNGRHDGGPAFPPQDRSIVIEADLSDEALRKTLDNLERERRTGMSLRDYFAAAAMQGWLATFDGDTPHPGTVINGDVETRDRRLQSFASMSYMVADAMVKAREA